MSHRILATDCTAGSPLDPVDAAFAEIVALASPVAATGMRPLAAACGRVLARDVVTGMALPPFDHSAVDGFGIAAADADRAPPLTLPLAAAIAAGATVGRPLCPGEAVRLFTGAPIPPGVAAVVLEERCRVEGRAVTINVPVPAGANIRRAGEDVARGSVIVEAETLLDARHLAILTAAGVTEVEVRRPVRVAVFSNGNELREPGAALCPGQIYDANRPMLTAMLAAPWIEMLDLGCHPDEVAAIRDVFGAAAGQADIVISSGGVAGSDADHIARSVAAVGGSVRRFRLAIKPGKPILAGRIGSTAVLGLPGNPVAAMVNFLLFGRALVRAAAGLPTRRPVGQAAVTATGFDHAGGRTEFAPVRICGLDGAGRPRLDKLGRGGSARLRPLVLADGLAEIPAGADALPAGTPLPFHPFHAAFAT